MFFNSLPTRRSRGSRRCVINDSELYTRTAIYKYKSERRRPRDIVWFFIIIDTLIALISASHARAILIYTLLEAIRIIQVSVFTFF